MYNSLASSTKELIDTQMMIISCLAIERVEIILVNEIGGQEHFDELADPDGNAPGGGCSIGIRRTQLQWNVAMFSKVVSTANQINDVKNKNSC